MNLAAQTPPPYPQVKIMQFARNFKVKTPILTKFWAQAPLGVKTLLGPLTKLLDMRLHPVYNSLQLRYQSLNSERKPREQRNSPRNAIPKLLAVLHVIFAYPHGRTLGKQALTNFVLMVPLHVTQ